MREALRAPFEVGRADAGSGRQHRDRLLPRPRRRHRRAAPARRRGDVRRQEPPPGRRRLHAATAIPIAPRASPSCRAAAGDRATAGCACTTSRRSSCARSAIDGVEALVRWQHPHGGLRAARSTSSRSPRRPGLIKPLTTWVLDAALRQVRAWRATGSTSRSRSTSPRARLVDDGLPEEIERAARRARGLARPALARDHREQRHGRPRGRHGDSSTAWRTWASASRSTTSAPATRRSSISRSSRWRRSRSTGPSSRG